MPTSIPELTSETQDEFLTLLVAFKGSPLEAAYWMKTVIGLTSRPELRAFLPKLAFHASAMTRLLRSIRSQGGDSELLPSLEREFSESLHRFHAVLTEVFSLAEPELIQKADRELLATKEVALRSLVSLAADLAVLKDFQLAMDDMDHAS